MESADSKGVPTTWGSRYTVDLNRYSSQSSQRIRGFILILFYYLKITKFPIRPPPFRITFLDLLSNRYLKSLSQIIFLFSIINLSSFWDFADTLPV